MVLTKYFFFEFLNFEFLIIPSGETKDLNYLEKATVERNGVKVGPPGKCSVYTGNFGELSGYGHSGVIGCISGFRQHCVSKTASHGAKRSEIWIPG